MSDIYSIILQVPHQFQLWGSVSTIRIVKDAFYVCLYNLTFFLHRCFIGNLNICIQRFRKGSYPYLKFEHAISSKWL